MYRSNGVEHGLALGNLGSFGSIDFNVSCNSRVNAVYWQRLACVAKSTYTAHRISGYDSFLYSQVDSKES